MKRNYQRLSQSCSVECKPGKLVDRKRAERCGDERRQPLCKIRATTRGMRHLEPTVMNSVPPRPRPSQHEAVSSRMSFEQAHCWGLNDDHHLEIMVPCSSYRYCIMIHTLYICLKKIQVILGPRCYPNRPGCDPWAVGLAPLKLTASSSHGTSCK